MESIEQRISKLVKEQYSKMKFSKKYSNRARLESKVQEIIYNEWGISNDTIWKIVEKEVEEIIPEKLD